MPRTGRATLAPLDTLFQTKRGEMLPLPPRLARLYGCLRMPRARSRPHVFSNFVSTLDGVVADRECAVVGQDAIPCASVQTVFPASAQMQCMLCVQKGADNQKEFEMYIGGGALLLIIILVVFFL